MWLVTADRVSEKRGRDEDWRHTNNPRGFGGSLHHQGTRDQAIPTIEHGEPYFFRPERSKRHDRDTRGFQILDSSLDIQEWLRAGTHDGDIRTTELHQVGRDVHRVCSCSVDTPDASGGEDFDPGQVGKDHGPGDSGAPAVQAQACDIWEVSSRDFHGRPRSTPQRLYHASR